jgi:purine-cytosine permease-like protein
MLLCDYIANNICHTYQFFINFLICIYAIIIICVIIIYMDYLTNNVFKFERVRLGTKTVTQYGEKYGTYLYRNIKTNELVASWEKPTMPKNYLYKGENIGYNTDALIYYKNT